MVFFNLSDSIVFFSDIRHIVEAILNLLTVQILTYSENLKVSQISWLWRISQLRSNSSECCYLEIYFHGSSSTLLVEDYQFLMQQTAMCCSSVETFTVQDSLKQSMNICQFVIHCAPLLTQLLFLTRQNFLVQDNKMFCIPPLLKKQRRTWGFQIYKMKLVVYVIFKNVTVSILKCLKYSTTWYKESDLGPPQSHTNDM